MASSLLIISFSYFLFLGNAQDLDHIPKSSLIKGIVKKVFNLTLEAFAKSPVEEREQMMVKIEKKVNKSAQFLGLKSGKYVKLIMDGVRSMAPADKIINGGDLTEHDSEEVSDSSGSIEKQIDIKKESNIKQSDNEIESVSHKVKKPGPEVSESAIMSRSQKKVIDSTINDIKNKVQAVDVKAKSSLVKGILRKVLNMTFASFAKSPYEERKKMIVNIEGKLNKSAQFLGRKSGKYVNLIMEGVRSLTSEHNLTDNAGSNIERTSQQKFQKIQNTGINKKHARLLQKDFIEKMKKYERNKYNNNDSSKNNEARRMEFEFFDNINVSKDQNTQSTEIIIVSHERDESNIVKNEIIDLHTKPYKPTNQDKNANICRRITALKTIKCTSKDLSVETLCDGIDDCFDYSDEHDCAIQGVGKVRIASKIMLDIENSLSDNCYMGEIDDSLITKQNEILRNVLQSQLKFIQKHASLTATNTWRSNLRKFYAEPEKVRRTVNEVAVVISSLASALEDTVCKGEFDVNARKSNIINATIQRTKYDNEIQTEVVEPELLKTSTQPPTRCNCLEGECMEACSSNCQSICLQRYQIGRWQCKAITNKKTISLDLICDGKFDCYDETDENECSIDFSRLDTAKAYSSVIDMITTKTRSANFEVVRNNLINLQRLIKSLQKLATKRTPDVPAVKASRMRCFSEMKEIYDRTRYNSVSMVPIHDIHLFLMSVNDKLVNAMKRSHIGNDRIIASDGCLCRDNQCALLDCSLTCVRACPAKPKLTRYFCRGSLALNHSIAIEAICNGKADCPDKDDEEGCSQDICRRHHLVLLSHNLQEAANERVKDTTVTEALKPWTTKVSATLKILGSNERPTPRAMRQIVNDMLRDLVMTYASLARPKRRNNDSLNQFYKAALVVMNSLKSCGK